MTPITGILVVLDIRDGSVHQLWSRHSCTSSVLAGVLVLLLTVLIIVRVTQMRKLRNQSRAIAVQAAIIVAQAARAVDAIKTTSRSTEEREAAAEELRTVTLTLLTSAPVLMTRTFRERFWRQLSAWQVRCSGRCETATTKVPPRRP